jgi:hypothetical protein
MSHGVLFGYVILAFILKPQIGLKLFYPISLFNSIWYFLCEEILCKCLNS